MKRAILFRFHASPGVCRNRIQLLRLFNPGTDILGLYGGDEDAFPRFASRLEGDLDGLYCVRGRSPGWKWKNGDLAIYDWYRDHGRRFSFDVVHVVEWDLLLFNPVAEVFRHVPLDAVGVAKLRPVSEYADEWVWTSHEPHRTQWLELLRLARDAHGYSGEPYTCNFAGASLPRAFLERCSGAAIPPLVNDEARLPLFAQAFGFTLVDNQLFDASRPDEERYFNLRGIDIRDEVVFRETMKKDGRRVFHPYKKVYHHLTTSGRAYNAYYFFARRLLNYRRWRRFSSKAAIS